MFTNKTIGKKLHGPRIHPLVLDKTTAVYDFEELLETWRKTENLQMREGLLHVGFSIKLGRRGTTSEFYTEADRIEFYLNIAEGWSSSNSYFAWNLPDNEEFIPTIDANGDVIKRSVQEFRKYVARKAFDMLCQKFFKIPLYDDAHPSLQNFNERWINTVLSETLFLRIQDFFHVLVEENRVTLPNLQVRFSNSSHNEEHAKAFLINLAHVLWGWHKPDTSYSLQKETMDTSYSSLKARIESAKPWMLEVLAILGKLNVLKKYEDELSKKDLAKIKEIALRTELDDYKHHVKKDRKARTIDEAAFAGSKAAKFLLEYDLNKRESERLRGILEAEEKVAEGTRKIKKLTAPVG